MEPYQIVVFSALPVVVGLATLWFARRAMAGDFHRMEQAQWHMEQRRTLLPIRLQAYERFTILLERISPESLLLRTASTGMSCAEYQANLLDAIRGEWHHNVSQQVYVSVDAWDAVKMAKARLVHIITQCGAKVHGDAPAMELSHLILAAIMAEDEHPTAAALRLLQREVAHLYA